jgi:hypothetical protein
MQDQTYSINQLLKGVENLSKRLKHDPDSSSLFTALQRAFSPESPLLPALKESILAAQDDQSQTSFDNVYKDLKIGDMAIYLQATHKEIFEKLKTSLQEFGISEYGSSQDHELALKLEPTYFFPRLFCVRVIDKGIRNNRPMYFCKIVSDNPIEQSELTLVCPEEDLFVSEDDIKIVRSLYQTNTDNSVKWLEEINSIKSKSLRALTGNLADAIQEDIPNSLESFEIYGLHPEE